MRPLTDTTPKPLLQVQGQSLLERILRGLPATVDHVLVVVSYLKQQIIDFMAQQNHQSNYTIVTQLPEPQGTGHAVLCCKPHLQKPDFLVLNADDLYTRDDLACLADVPLGVLGAQRHDPTQFGVLVQNDEGNLIRIHEKPLAGIYTSPVYISTGAFKFHKGIFDHKLQLSERGEYEITDYLTYIARQDIVSIVKARFWFPVGTPEALKQAQNLKLIPD